MPSELKFFKEHRDRFPFLSNFYAPKHGIVIQSTMWKTLEHYYQAMKTLDPDARIVIRCAETPLAAKRLGRSVVMREDWDNVKRDVMLLGLRCKFTQDPVCKTGLLMTADAVLIEDSPYDWFWGKGLDGKGKNMLGRLLEVVRNELISNAIHGDPNMVFYG